jgi:hypothetical protein
MKSLISKAKSSWNAYSEYVNNAETSVDADVLEMWVTTLLAIKYLGQVEPIANPGGDGTLMSYDDIAAQISSSIPLSVKD